MAAEVTRFLVTWMKSVRQERKNDRLQLGYWVLNILHLSEHTPSAPGNCSLTLEKESQKRQRDSQRKPLFCFCVLRFLDLHF